MARQHEPEPALEANDHDARAVVDDHAEETEPAARDAASPSWAKTRRTQIEKTRAHVHAQQFTLIADARLSLTSLRAAQRVFTAYEVRYAAAKQRFEDQLGKYVEAAQKRRDDIDAALALVLGVIPETRLLKVIEHVQEAAERIDNVMTLRGDKALGVDGKEHAPVSMTASDKTRLDWLPLVDHALGAFDGFITMTESLTLLDVACDGAIGELTTELEGGDAPADLEARTRGLVGVTLPSSTGTMADALAFLLEVNTKLGAQTQQDIERRLAEQWMAELDRTQVTDAITDVQPYLESIGVIGPRSENGLRIDSHGDEWVDATADHEQLMMWVRAQVKVEAEDAVGRKLQWLGGISNGERVQGAVRLDGHLVTAVGPAESRDGKCIDKAVTEAGGGFVKVIEARWRDTPIEVTSNWKGRGVKDYFADMRASQVELVVEATASTGDGVVLDDSGPSMSAGS